MLVLELKQGEAVHIGGYQVIVVRALDVGRRQIKFSIEAPEDVQILRSELVEADD